VCEPIETPLETIDAGRRPTTDKRQQSDDADEVGFDPPARARQ
jgi:hypothetical protein